MAKKHTPSPTELVNDPSLRWNPYRWGEVVTCDLYPEPVRFHSYTADGKIVVASVNSISPLGEPVDRMRVRRI